MYLIKNKEEDTMIFIYLWLLGKLHRVLKNIYTRGIYTWYLSTA